VFGSPEVAEKKLPRSGPSLHEIEKGSCRGRLSCDLATLFPELKDATNDVTNADTGRPVTDALERNLRKDLVTLG